MLHTRRASGLFSMITLADILQDDVEFLVTHLPRPDGLDFTVVIDGNTIPAGKNTIRRDKLLGIEGLHDRYRFSVYVAQQNLLAVPEVDTLIEVDGVDYVILAKESDDIEQLLRLDVGDEFTDIPPIR